MSLEGPNFDEIKAKLKAGDARNAFELLRRTLRPDDPFVTQARAARLYRSMARDGAELRPLKIALLAGSTVDHLADVLRLWLATVGFDAEIYVAPFDMVVQTVLDEASDLYAFKPDVVWLCTTHRDVPLEIAAGSDIAAVRAKVERAVQDKQRLWQVLLQRCNCLVVQNNADCPADDPFGNIAGAAPWGGRSALRLYNFELGAAALPGVAVFDLDHLASLYGKAQWFDSRYWFHSKHAFAPDATGLVAASLAQLVAAAKGLAKKCLVLDLDNTLWGGVIGDDGLEGIALGQKADGEAYVAFQAYARALKERGIVLAVCSKNDEAIAKEAFEHHPDMRLRLSDIAVFRANWNSKVENVRDIAATLSIGIDSLVFADDNPAERDIVRQFLPAVAVPELPDDPADYVRVLARYYAENAQRAELQLSFQDTADYLASLQMVAEIGAVDALNLPRLAQLINKSNQFHLTGTRYSEAELAAFATRPGYVIRNFRLRDRFGDNGLIAVVVLRVLDRDLVIDTWVMSCRVLARSMEEFICNEMLRVARERHCTSLVGLYKPTAKNKLVAGLYPRLGFEKVADTDGVSRWRRAVGPASSDLTTYARQLEMTTE